MTRLTKSAVRWGVTLFLAGCAHRLPRGGVDAVAEYYPLAVGNLWTYERDLLGEKGTLSVEILRKQGSFFLDTQGAELSADGNGVRDQRRYLLQRPLEKDAVWTNVVSANSVEHYRILAVGEPCSAPAGNFEGCIRVASRNRVDAETTLVAEFTFAPHVGLLRMRTFAQRAGKGALIPQATLTLKSFKIRG